MVNEIDKMFIDDMYGVLENEYKLLCKLMEPINQKPLNWKIAARFVEDNKFQKQLTTLKQLLMLTTI